MLKDQCAILGGVQQRLTGSRARRVREANSAGRARRAGARYGGDIACCRAETQRQPPLSHAGAARPGRALPAARA